MEENIFQNNKKNYDNIIIPEEEQPKELAKDLEHFKREFQEFKKETREAIEAERSANRNMIIGVIVAALFIFMVLAVEIMIFHTRDQNIGDEYRRKIDKIKAQIITEQNKNKQ